MKITNEYIGTIYKNKHLDDHEWPTENCEVIMELFYEGINESIDYDSIIIKVKDEINVMGSEIILNKNEAKKFRDSLSFLINQIKE